MQQSTDSDAVAASRRLPPLVFVVGAAALGVEIAAVRLLAPYFGASEVVWANTIGVVLVALSIGYWLGGKIADRRPHMRDLCATVMLAAVLTALLPFVAKPLLNAGVDALEQIEAGAFVGSLIATLVLISVPVLVMGTVAPWALRIGIDAVGPAQAGALAGRLYAVSTAGSLVGTLLAALVLVPGVGTRRTFLIFALALALAALLGAVPRAASPPSPLAIGALMALPAGGVKSQSTAGRVIHEQETRNQYARVIERDDGSRVLELNEGQAIHSLYRPDTVLTGNYWDTALVLPLAALAARTAAHRRCSATPPARSRAPTAATSRDHVRRRRRDRRTARGDRPPLVRSRRRALRGDRRRRPAVPARDRRPLRRDRARRLPPALHPLLPDDARVLRLGARPAGRRRRGDRQRRPPQGQRRTRERTGRDDAHGRSRTCR